MLEIDALNKRSVKLIVSFLLCFVFVFSFFVMTIEKSEAIATIPLVAIPIIKLLIASGVTFLSVDAMLEVYNQIKGTTYYNTLTGYILDATQNSIDYIKAEFGDALKNYYPGWDPRDPTIPDLLLGTITLMIAKNDIRFQDFLNWFYDFFAGYDEVEFKNKVGEITLPDDFNEDGHFYYYLAFPGDYIVVDFQGYKAAFVRKDNNVYDYTRLAFTFLNCDFAYCGGNSSSVPQTYYVANELVDRKVDDKGANPNLQIRGFRVYSSVESLEGFAGSFFIGNPCRGTWYGSKYAFGEFGSVPVPVTDYPLEVPDIEIDEDENFPEDDEIEEFPLWLPLPNEIITIDPDEGLDIDPDKEIDLNTFDELMTPWVGTTWTDIVTEVPVTPTVPGYVPGDYPIPGGEPTIPELPDTPDVPDDAGEGDDPFEGADPGLKINWDPLKKAGLQNKFPFCIPWDLYNSFSSFNVQGEAPVWEITYLDDTGFVIDFGIFEPWAVIIRWGLLIFFNVGLIILTRNIIRG